MAAGWCLLSVLLGVTTAAIPQGYHLQVTPLCATSKDNAASVTIRTDLDVYANAFCQDQTPVEFQQVDSATLSLDLSYPGSKSPKDCVFRKRKGADVYFIRVIVSFGEKGAEIHTEEEMFTVTCTFDPKGSKISGKKFVKGRILAPKEIKSSKSNKGPKSKSKLNLILTDITRHSLMGKPINLGRKVLLIASTDGSSGEKGVRITSCDAVGTKSRYQVIRAGCGDGQVFSKTQGFVTTGLTAMSPYFDMFHLMNDKSVTFDCNFTLCKTTCDGSSCENERRRRASDFVAPETQKPVLINSAPGQFKNRSAHEVEHVKLFLTNVAGFQLHNVSLQRGRPYVLHVTTDGKQGEVGLKVMHCDIVTTKTQHNRRMAAIRDGCGVEPVFRPDKGFVTSGLTATSPYFEGFSIRGDNSLAFQCNVILCHQKCDGRTCSHERPKRDLEKQEPFLESGNVQSASFVVNSRVKRSWWLKDMLEAARNRNL